MDILYIINNLTLNYKYEYHMQSTSFLLVVINIPNNINNIHTNILHALNILLACYVAYVLKFQLTVNCQEQFCCFISLVLLIVFLIHWPADDAMAGLILFHICTVSM